MSNPAKRLALSIKDCTDETGIGVNALYDAVRDGILKARKVGRRTIILRADLEAYLNALPPLDLGNNPHTPACRNKAPVGRRKRVSEGVSGGLRSTEPPTNTRAHHLSAQYAHEG